MKVLALKAFLTTAVVIAFFQFIWIIVIEKFPNTESFSLLLFVVLMWAIWEIITSIFIKLNWQKPFWTEET